MLVAYDYPGNVRELRNLVERLVILSEGPFVSGAEAEALLPRRRMGTGNAEAMTMAGMPAPLSASPTPVPQVTVTLPAPRFRPDKTFRDQVDEAERDIILGALSFTKDNATEAAKLLDLERGHFYKKMKSLGLRRQGGETSSASEPNVNLT